LSILGARSTRHAAGPEDRQTVQPICHAPSLANQAALTLEGESRARAHLDRIGAGSASPDELTALVASLRGEMLAGFCRLCRGL